MKKKKEKEPSLLRKLIDIHYEQAKRHKALRILNKQEWSVEFLEYLVNHAARGINKQIIISVTSPKGHVLEIKSVQNYVGPNEYNDDIFNKLDDDAAVNAFIREHSSR